MTDFYPGDRYETEKGVKRFLSEYLLFGTRWSPYSHFIFGSVFPCRRLALEGKYDDEAWAKSSNTTLKMMERCGAHFIITGMDKIRSLIKPAVFAANHMSTLETTILPGLICPIRPVTYIVKEKLVHGPIWGPIMRSRDPIVVTRKDPKGDLEVVLRDGQERLSRGISVIVFPEGTRRDEFDPSHFNSLGAKLAAKAGVPLVPVALKTDFWGNSPIFRGFGPVHRSRTIYFDFGDPLTVIGRGKTEHDATLKFIEGRLRKWGAKVVEKTDGGS